MDQGIRNNMIQAMCIKYKDNPYYELRKKYETRLFINMTNQK